MVSYADLPWRHHRWHPRVVRAEVLKSRAASYLTYVEALRWSRRRTGLPEDKLDELIVEAARHVLAFGSAPAHVDTAAVRSLWPVVVRELPERTSTYRDIAHHARRISQV